MLYANYARSPKRLERSIVAAELVQSVRLSAFRANNITLMRGAWVQNLMEGNGLHRLPDN